MPRVVLPVLKADEIKNITMDFISALAIGETISTATTTSSTYSGTDSGSNTIVNGAASISGTVVTQSLKGSTGTVGTIYDVEVKITTSASQTLVQHGYVVLEAATVI